MSALTKTCSICGHDFDVELNYQMEERTLSGDDGPHESGFVFYCSEACLDRSIDGEVHTLAACDACGSSFVPTGDPAPTWIDGEPKLSCSVGCRAQLLAEARGTVLGRIPLPSDRPGPSDPPRVIAVLNHKGGTGKTTTAVTLAAGVALRGRRVLLVDADAQGSVAASLGLSVERSLYHVLVMGLRLAQAVAPVAPNLDVLPANETLAAAELYLVGRRRRERVLAERLAGVHELYDYVVVDCSPSLSLVNQNVLTFADSVLCPTACDFLSMVGVRQVLKTLRSVDTHLGHPVRLWGVLPTLYDPRLTACRDALEALGDQFGSRCFEPIRQSAAAREAPAHGVSVFEHAPASSAARDYLQLVERLLSEGDWGTQNALPA